jgi:hypothetical protein
MSFHNRFKKHPHTRVNTAELALRVEPVPKPFNVSRKLRVVIGPLRSQGWSRPIIMKPDAAHAQFCKSGKLFL